MHHHSRDGNGYNVKNLNPLQLRWNEATYGRLNDYSSARVYSLQCKSQWLRYTSVLKRRRRHGNFPVRC